jgi:hypothetical protein
MARLKFKQIYSNLQYDTASAILTLSGSRPIDFAVSGTINVVSNNTYTGSITIQNLDTFGDSGSFFTMDLGDY